MASGENGAAATMPVLESIVERLDRGNGRSGGVHDILDTIGNRAFGSPESGKEGPSCDPVPEALVDRAMVALDRLDETILRLETAAVRLQGIA